MTKSISEIIDDLRARLASIEDAQNELLAERDDGEIAFSAHVEGDAKAIKRLAEINAELGRLQGEASTVGAALAEAARREMQARDQDLAERRRADGEQAETILAETEKLAAAMDAAMVSLKAAAVDFQDKMLAIRRLSGAGPQHTAIRVHLARALSSGLMGLPQHPDLLAPNERRSVTELTTAWATQVRNRIATIIETPARAA
jgi:chromosome segregation ATPase